MTIECPKCQFDNPNDTAFCGKCGTNFDAEDAIHTKTLETPTEELTRGSVFAGRYEIIEELGKGGMGRVYRVEDKKIKKEIALKLIKPEIASDKKTIERFKNELTTARDIRHKNVCGMFDLGEEKGQHYISMEYVSGEDLKSFIRRSKQLSIPSAISIANQVCEGLAEAHRLGVIHRDLKPSNIMIDKQGNARIMDFGIARSMKTKGITGAGVMIGTPEYMSPEQVEAKDIDQRSDVYSLGIILYEMTTGNPPFEADTPFAVGIKQKSEDPIDPKELNSQISDDLSQVIMRCLKKEKEQRYKSAEGVSSELKRIEDELPTTSRQTPEQKTATSKEITLSFSLKKLTVPIIAITCIIFGIVIVWQLLKKQDVFSAQKINNSLAIISFENQTGDPAYDNLRKAIPSLLITNLEQAGGFYVVTWERMHDLLKQMGKKEVDSIARNSGFELCQREGVEKIVVGSFVKTGEMFAIDAKILDVESKKLIKSASSRGRGEDSILETQIDELSQEIFIGLDLVRQEKNVPQLKIAEVTTTSLEAYNYYLQGQVDYENFKCNEAQVLLEKAVELDPDFAMAHLYLAWTYEELGSDDKEAEAYERAKALSRRATEKEKLLIEADYTRVIEKDSAKYSQLIKNLVKKFPKDKRLHFYLGFHLEGKGFMDEALAEYKESLELDPNYGVVLNQSAFIYSDIGKFETAIKNLKKYASLFPTDANPVDSIAEMYFRMGDFDKSLAKYKEAVEIKPDFGSDAKIAYIYTLKEDYANSLKWFNQNISMASSLRNKAGGLYSRAMFYHLLLGDYEKALRDTDTVEGINKEVGDQSMTRNLDWIQAWIYYEKGELEPAIHHFKTWSESWIEASPSSVSYYTAIYYWFEGSAAIMQGDVKRARTNLTKIESLMPDISPSGQAYLEIRRGRLLSEVLLVEGSPEKAISISLRILPEEMPQVSDPSLAVYNIIYLKDVLARAYHKKGDIDKAIETYEHLISPGEDNQNRYLIHPKYHYRLGKLFEQKGRKNKAIAEYDKFLDFWKDADPSLPEVEDARKRLAGLKE